MASNDYGVQSSSWLYGIPDFYSGALFVYFNDLANIAHNSPPCAERKLALFQQASGAANAIGNTIRKTTDDIGTIQNALNFLLTISNSEQNKELKVLQQYRDLLKQTLPEDDTIDQYLSAFSDPSILSDSQRLIDVYQHIVKYLTVIRTNAEQYKQRLQNFKRHQELTMHELYDDDFRMRLAGEIHSIEVSATGQLTKNYKDNDAVYASLLRSTVGDYIVSHDILSKISMNDDILAIISAIAIDLEAFIEKEMIQLKKDTRLASYDTQELKDMMQNYLDSESREQTRLEKAIEKNGKELRDILNATETILGIRKDYMTDPEKLFESREKSYKKQLGRNDSIINKIVDKELNKDILEKLFSLKFTNTAENKSIHGNIFELLNVIINENTVKVSGSAATDTITLGSVQITLNPSFDTSELMEHVRNISQQFTNFATKQRKDRFDQQERAFKTMNSIVEEQTQAIDTLLQKMESEGLDVDDVFIYHDSLKLYKSMETGESNRFEGRELNILNYIDEMYAINNLGDLALPQKDALQFLIMNLPEGAVGSGQKDTIEKYLGLFAGMLMFDDAVNMAKEAVAKTSSDEGGAKARNIHLYNLNGFYIPASMLLRYTYETMSNFLNNITKYGTKVSISTKVASEYISDWLSNQWRHGEDNSEKYYYYYSANEWARVGEAVANSISIRIIFFSAFATFIQNLP